MNSYMDRTMNNISIHHSAPIKNEFSYTYELIHKIADKRQSIQLIKDMIFMIILGAFMVLRAYVFFEYGK